MRLAPKKQLCALWDNIFDQSDDPKKRSLIDLLSGIPLFSELSHRELKRVARITHHRYYAQGEEVFHIGHPGAAMFIIITGQIDIQIPTDSTPLLLASLSSGAFMGELALLDDSPRSATAVAAIDTQAIAFFRSDLNKLLETDANLASKILKSLALIIGQRLKLTNQQLLQAQKSTLAGSDI